jgi:Zn-dependent protease
MRLTFIIGRFFDIRVGVHVSWLALYAFVTLSIAGSITGVSHVAAVALAAVCALLVFLSVIAHEFAHALVARGFGVRTKAITLFLFGGVAMLESEPPSPRAEALIALAGPGMSGVLALTAYGLLCVCERWSSGSLADAVGMLLAYLSLANAVLALFNLAPAFPMDGGRVLRAAVWQLRKSRAAATGAASIVSLVLAGALAVGGLVTALVFHSWQYAWYSLVGGFLLRQGWLQFHDSRYIERLERVRVSDVMDAAGARELPGDGFSLASSASALDAVSVFRASNRTEIAVVDAGRLSGWLNRERMLEIFDRAA